MINSLIDKGMQTMHFVLFTWLSLNLLINTGDGFQCWILIQQILREDDNKKFVLEKKEGVNSL